MPFSIATILMAVGVLLLVSTISSKVSGRYGVPTLVVFLTIGMLAGSEGLGGIPFDNYAVAQAIGIVALALILFSGGLDTEWKEVRPILLQGLSLGTVGVVVTAVVVGGITSLAFDITLPEGLLVGAIVSSTDAAAVLSILRTQKLKLNGHLQPLLELESGCNDPMAVFLTVSLTSLVANPSTELSSFAGTFVIEMLVGAATGYAIGRVGVWTINNLKLEIEGLYPVLMLSIALLAYGVAAQVHGNGFLAVYIAGLVIGNGDIVYRRSLMRFHEGLAWLMQITMFLALGLLIFPSRLPAAAGPGVLIAAVLIFAARPLCVFIALSLSRMPFREKVFVSWVGLRGAVPIVLATFPLLAGLPNASLMFDIVFFTVVVSVLLQGTSISTVARWLGVGDVEETRPRSPIEYERTDGSSADLIELVLPAGSRATNRTISELGLPSGVLVVLLNREGEFVIVRGDTVLQEGDALMILAEPEMLGDVRRILASA